MIEVVDGLQVCWYPALQRWCLHDRLTGGSEVLPAAAGAWALSSSSDGKAFASSDGQPSLWCMDLLPHTQWVFGRAHQALRPLSILLAVRSPWSNPRPSVPDWRPPSKWRALQSRLRDVETLRRSARVLELESAS